MADSIELNDARSLRAYAHPLRMRLIGLLRTEGPLTATRAAARLGDNVPNCSFHLRQLAKYGLVERAPAADGRERPWQATAQQTSWADDSDDPAVRQAADQVTGVVLGLYAQRAQEYLAVRGSEPAQWRRAAGFSDLLAHLTADELAELSDQIDALVARYDDRLTDPALRPPGSRPVQLIRMSLPRDAT
jgi:predicted ArsR family transcriptional regulator